MKIQIKLRPGERPLAPDDLKKIVSQLTRCEHLEKADKIPRPMDYRVLQTAVDHTNLVAEKIRQKMLQKMERVLKDL